MVVGFDAAADHKIIKLKETALTAVFLFVEWILWLVYNIITLLLIHYQTNMKKSRFLLAGALVMLLAGGALFVSRGQARAEDSQDSQNNSSSTEQANQASENAREQAKQASENAREKAKQDSENAREKAKHDNEDVNKLEDEEDGANSHMDSLDAVTSSTLSSLSEVDSGSLKTYGDVVAVLQNFSTALDQLAAKAGVTSSVETGLSQPEMALLSSLVLKNKLPFARLTTRIQEIKDQMKVVVDLLTPLAGVDISPLLKKPLLSVVKDFREEVKSLGELEHLNFDIISNELFN